MMLAACERRNQTNKSSHKFSKPYVGRFAPSPSGPLHLGSLYCAIASYLDAKANNGTWLIRIEDVDLTRCDHKYSQEIIDSLNAHGMTSDGRCIIQSQRSHLYESKLKELRSGNCVYACDCTRKTIKAEGNFYGGRCRHLDKSFSSSNAIRIINKNRYHSFEDLIQRNVRVDAEFSQHDFILKRRDGCFAYNLAVVVDDIEQNITRVVRGSDLIDTTVLQLYLFQSFNSEPPQYAHIPVLAESKNKKLSKQNHAKPIDIRNAVNNVRHCLSLLGYQADHLQAFDNCESLLSYASSEWHLRNIKRNKEVIL